MTTNPDVLGFDHYPFPAAAGTIRSDFYQNLEIIRKQALLGNVDFWSYIQSMGITGVFRSPNQNEMRYDVYANLIYGAKGIIYFTYALPDVPGFHGALASVTGTPTASYSWAQGINAEVLNLGPTLTGLTSLGVYHSGTLPAGASPIPPSFFVQPADNTQPIIEGYFQNASGRKYVMLMNRDFANSRTLNFNVNPKPSSLTEISKTTGQEVGVSGYNASTGVLNITLLPGEGRLFALPSAYSLDIANAGFELPDVDTFTYRPSMNGWTFANDSGVQRNGSAWGASNAPEGAQTAFLQGTGTITQTVNFPAAGSYTVKFQAAKRTTTGGAQTFNVYCDNTLIGSFTPSTGSFSTFTTSSFSVTAGNHTIKFAGTTTGDNTAFVDLVQIFGNGV